MVTARESELRHRELLAATIMSGALAEGWTLDDRGKALLVHTSVDLAQKIQAALRWEERNEGRPAPLPPSGAV